MPLTPLEKEAIGKKPNAGAVLMNLPTELQEEIYAYATGDGKSSGHSQEETSAWLKETKQIDATRPTVGRFLKWYKTIDRFQTARNFATAMVGTLRAIPGTRFRERQLLRIGQVIFEARAIENEDDKLFIALKRLELLERELAIKEAEAHFRLRQGNQQIKTVKGKEVVPEVNNYAAIEAMRLIAFRDVDELQASGKVVIPE
jgi:hypothetical protein